MRRMVLALMLGACMSISACIGSESTTPAAPATPATPAAATPAAEKVACGGCGMNIDKTATTLHKQVGGAEKYFCSDGCMNKVN